MTEPRRAGASATTWAQADGPPPGALVEGRLCAFLEDPDAFETGFRAFAADVGGERFPKTDGGDADSQRTGAAIPCPKQPG